MNLEVGVFKHPEHPQTNFGWEIVLEQEKTPHRLTTEPDCPIIVCNSFTPDWLPDFMEDGGICIVDNVKPRTLPFRTDYAGCASIEQVDLTQLGSSITRMPCLVSLFKGIGLGTINIHANRIQKNNIVQDQFPVFIFQQFGKGGCFYSGIPLTDLIVSLGDALRVAPYFSDFTERMVAVDKHNIIRALRSLLVTAFNKLGLPYTHLWYFPQEYKSAFTFRIDVDGVFGDNLEKISNSALKNGMTLSFFINKSLCEKDRLLLYSIRKPHEIGNHADIHNLFSDYNSNRINVTACKDWLDDNSLDNGPWFTAPRGMWNYTLHQVLEDLGYAYTSDFGCAVSGHPFFPYLNGKRSKTLQIPVHPFSAERGNVWLKEGGNEPISSEFVCDSFINIIQSCYSNNYPAMLYSHPEIFGGMADLVFPRLKQILEKHKIWITTLSEYVEWWKYRDLIHYSANYDVKNDTLSLAIDKDCQSLINIISDNHSLIRTVFYH